MRFFFLAREEAFLRLFVRQNSIWKPLDVVDEGNLEVKPGLVIRLDDFTKPKLDDVLAFIHRKQRQPCGDGGNHHHRKC